MAVETQMAAEKQMDSMQQVDKNSFLQLRVDGVGAREHCPASSEGSRSEQTVGCSSILILASHAVRSAFISR